VGGKSNNPFLVTNLPLGNPYGRKALLCTQGATPIREVAEARQSLASKCVPKQELGDEVKRFFAALRMTIEGRAHSPRRFKP
jgi:hypothetical protein